MAPRRGRKPAKQAQTYDYSGLEKGMRCQAETDSVFYSAEVVKVSKARNRTKAPVKVHFTGYEDDWDSWVGGDRLRSKALKSRASTEAKKRKADDKRGARPQTVLRIANYKSETGKEEAFDIAMQSFIEDPTNEKVWIVFHYTFPRPGTVTFVILFKSQEDCDYHQESLRKGMLEKLKDVIDPSHEDSYESSGPLRSFRNREVVPDDDSILRVSIYSCKEGKEADLATLAAGLPDEFRKDAPGLAWLAVGTSGPGECFVASVHGLCQSSLRENKEELEADRATGVTGEKIPITLSNDYAGTTTVEGPLHSLSREARYYPNTVRAAWDNHFAAFGAQDLEKIILDYNDDSIARICDDRGNVKTQHKGTTAILGMFAGLFEDLKTLSAPVCDVDEEGSLVLFCCECPGCDYEAITSTFLFKKVRGQVKISRHNILLTKSRDAESALPALWALPLQVVPP